MTIYSQITLGWSPEFSVVTDGIRRVLEVVAWVGGTGSAPATGLYVGATGFVVDITDAVDIRGSIGATGATGATGSTGATGAGVATGGVANDALLKVDGTDYNTAWGKITNNNLSGTAGITNANLANSAITINGTSTALGSSIDTRPVSASVSGSNVTTTLDTASDITGLSVAVAANKIYRVTATLFVGCNNTGGVKFAINAPSGAVGLSGVWTGSAAGVTASQVVKMQTTLGNLTNIAFVRVNNSGGMAQFVGYITTSSTAGNIVLQFASGVASETSTIFIGSTMDIIEIV